MIFMGLFVLPMFSYAGAVNIGKSNGIHEFPEKNPMNMSKSSIKTKSSY